MISTGPCVVATRTAYAMTQQKAVGELVNILGLNQHFPCLIVYAGKEYFGLEVTELATEKGQQKLKDNRPPPQAR